MIATAIAVLILVSGLIQIGYGLCFFRRIWNRESLTGRRFQREDDYAGQVTLPISVVVCAKNEAQNLTENLSHILEQQYCHDAGDPLFEVVVVNDQSTDGTAEVLEHFALKYTHLRVVTIAADAVKTLPGKKFALSRALEACRYKHLLMTDADCRPASPFWISRMASGFRDGTEIVAGYGGYYRRPGLLNAFIRCETVHTFLQYSTYNMAGLPYMAVGRNLACHRSLLQKAQQSPVWKQTASGDDDLLISLCAGKDNMRIIADPDAFTWSAAKENWSAWVRQKQRHFSTGKLYKPFVQALLGGYACSHAAFWLGLMALLCWPYGTTHTGASIIGNLLPVVVAARISLMWATWAHLSDRLGDRRIKWGWPFFDFAWLGYNFIFAPWIFWKNKRQWT